MKEKFVLVILGDTPTKETGFGRVVRNLVREWKGSGLFAEIHIWGIGYWGMPHDYPANVKLYPAASPHCQRWEDIENLKRFGALAAMPEVTHIWMIQDVWGLLPLSQLLRKLSERGKKTLLYFPADAPLDNEWMEIVASVDTPVAYCGYGYTQALVALSRTTGDKEMDGLYQAATGRIQVMPHGVDACFRIDTGGQTEEMRQRITAGETTRDDVLLVNVASHQRRKGLTQTLQLWAALRQYAIVEDRRMLLYMHCLESNGAEGTSLRSVAGQLGLEDEIGKTLFFGHKSYFPQNRPMATDQDMNLIYNAADWLISTSLGEGWGLPLTEAMATETPVMAPDHTSCRELIGGREERGWLLPAMAQADMVIGDNSRLRRRVMVEASAERMAPWMFGEEFATFGKERIARARKWVRSPSMSWGSVARKWLQLMGVTGTGGK